MRAVMWTVLGFAAASAVGAWICRGSALLLLALAALIGFAATAFLSTKHRKWLPAALVLLGLVCGSIYFERFDANTLESARQLDGKTIAVAVTADSCGWETDFGTAVKGTMRFSGRTYRLQLYLNEKLEIDPGDRIETKARLRLTDSGGSRAPTFHRGNGIFLLGYQKGDCHVIPGAPRLRHLPARLREAGLHRIGDHFSADTAGFAQALLLGDKHDLSYAQMTDFKVTGISHVVAVSGLHLSILFGIVYVLAGKQRIFTVLLGIPCALLFAATVGFTPSVTRAALMLTVFMGALAFDREYDPPTALAIAVLLMLLHNPLVITSVGFQMSVGSVAGIFCFYRPIREWIWERIPKSEKKKARNRISRALTASVSVTLSATVLSGPLAAFYFGTFSLIGIVTNLLVIPVVSVIFWGVLAVCLTAGLPILPELIAGGTGWLIRYVLKISHLLGRLPNAAVYTASPYISLWLVFLCALMLALICGRLRRPVFCAEAAVLGLLLAMGLSFFEPLRDDYRVTALDVGQGQCVMLQSGANTVLVDCGGTYDENAADTAAETLLSMGISRIDGLILSHYDRDHCGGIAYLARRIKIDRAFLPVPPERSTLSDRVIAGLNGTQILWIDRDLECSFGDSRITVFAPEKGGTDNESCAAVLFQRGKCDTLIIGDLPASGEKQLLSRALPDLEVLVVGHHGSKSSTCQELLDATAPDVAMISAGKHNSYGHPAPEVLKRLTEAGCLILRTDTMGTVTYRR